MSVLEYIVLFAAAASAIGFFVGRFIKLFRTWFKFVDDWNGNEERLGVIDRLAEGSDRFDKIESEISIIKSELFNNHGTSLRDAIDRIEKNTSK